MTQRSSEISIQTAAITDRGLNERRPLNEDSMLSDPERRIFAVADGVGGAEAGEVASQTAVEVLDEAFRHHGDGEDYEDLMEIAIQRANASIYRMSREQPRLSMMATTIVALHLDGLRATIGHVGDSRLYRLLPGGRLQRETDDHSVVEEEVRAGRMTAAQAANHPSRNVISRALGAEPSVEVDMKTIEFESGTVFLLCSDGITRHIPDEEMDSLLRETTNLEEACAEMKRRCYERGAEDNLTAVLVRAGGENRHSATTSNTDEEQTLIAHRPDIEAAPTGGDDNNSDSGSILRRPFSEATAATTHAATPATTTSGDQSPGVSGREQRDASEETRAHERPAASGANNGRTARLLAVLFIALGLFLLAFYAGWRFGRNTAETGVAASSPAREGTPTLQSASQSQPVEDPEAAYLRRRRAVDIAPAAEAERMAREMNNEPLNSDDPEFLYLYGRAMLLRGRQQDALPFFEKAIRRIEENTTSRNAQLKFDARLATVAAHLRSNDEAKAREALGALDEFIRDENAGTQANVAPTTAASPF